MQANSSRDFTVGLFVVTGLAAIAYLSIQVGGLSYTGPGGLRLVGSFDEIGVLGGRAEYDAEGNLTDFLPANCVFGRARLDGRLVVVSGDDFTVRGGANDAAIREKNIQAERMAHDLKLPIVRLIEGTGGGVR